MGLLVSYSLGLGVPFVISAVLIDQLEGTFAWVKRHYDVIDKVSGALLVIVGVLMATGMLGSWLRLLAF
jgi:cytochrome c-type biogenesis protein